MADLYGVEICVPFHGQYLSVRNLIESILIGTKQCPYRIVLIDDASPNKDFLPQIKELSNVVEGIRLQERRGLGGALNAAINVTKLPFLVFMHSDMKIVDSKWLIELYRSYCRMDKSNNVKMVCATSNNPPFMCESLRRNRNELKADAVATEPLPIFASLCSRSLFDKVGGFREYKYGYFEDQEFYYRLKRWGFNEGISGSSYVEHYGGKTVQSLWQSNPEAQTIMTETNRSQCLRDVKQMWGK